MNLDLRTRWTARATRSLSPGRIRAVTVRRALAGLLLLGAVVLVVVGRTGEHRETVVVAAHDLRPGIVVSDDDLRLAQVPPGAALRALREVRQVSGHRLTGAVAAGEAVTGSRLLTSRLPAALTGDPAARLVPVRPADAAVSGLLRAGDVVDVLDEEARVLATGAVVAVPAGPSSRTLAGGAAAPVLLAMKQGPAHRVAATGLSHALTLVLH